MANTVVTKSVATAVSMGRVCYVNKDLTARIQFIQHRAVID